MRKFGVFPSSRQWWAQPNQQLVVVCLGNSVHLWCVLEHVVTSLWGHRAGANVSSELHGDLMKQQRPHQRSARINLRRKIKTLQSWSIILFYSAYCWSHSWCGMLRSLIAAAPVLSSVLFSQPHHSWHWPAPWLPLTWDPFVLPGLLCRALLWAQPPCLCVLCLLTFEPWELLHTGSKNSPECCNTVK